MKIKSFEIRDSSHADHKKYVFVLTEEGNLLVKLVDLANTNGLDPNEWGQFDVVGPSKRLSDD